MHIKSVGAQPRIQVQNANHRFVPRRLSTSSARLRRLEYLRFSIANSRDTRRFAPVIAQDVQWLI
jgi:hypothetical protein